MVEHITKGIKVSVASNFEGTLFKDATLLYAFSYTISIENNSNVLVQLNKRNWIIHDALNSTKQVSGIGVIGETPIINPTQMYSYTSGCILNASFGSMKGYYTLLNLNTLKPFKVFIPNFKLHADFALN